MLTRNEDLRLAVRAKPAESRVAAFVELARTYGVLTSSRRVLELGCGTGTRARELAPYFDESLGIDPVAADIRTARVEVGGDGVSFFVGDGVEPGDFGGEPFDLILCDVSRIPAGRHALERVASLLRSLAPGGLVLLDVPRRRFRGRVRGPAGTGCGTVSFSWRQLGDAIWSEGGRIMWADKHRGDGTLYCVVRDAR